jgi:hypothetical protein
MTTPHNSLSSLISNVDTSIQKALSLAQLDQILTDIDIDKYTRLLATTYKARSDIRTAHLIAWKAKKEQSAAILNHYTFLIQRQSETSLTKNTITQHNVASNMGSYAPDTFNMTSSAEALAVQLEIMQKAVSDAETSFAITNPQSLSNEEIEAEFEAMLNADDSAAEDAPPYMMALPSVAAPDGVRLQTASSASQMSPSRAADTARPPLHTRPRRTPLSPLATPAS